MGSSQSDQPEKRIGAEFTQLLGLEAVETREGFATVKLTLDDRHLRTLGFIHGGVAATLLDSAMGRATWTVVPADHFCVTVQMNLNFIRPAWKGETLIATGEILHRGHKTAVLRGDVRNDEGSLIATGTSTFMFVPHPTNPGEDIPKQ